MNRQFLSAALTLSLFTSACGSDDETDQVAAATPGFAVATRSQVSGANDLAVVVGFTDDLATGELDLTNSIEVGGQGTMHGLDGTGEFYISRGEDLTLTKYRFAEGTLEIVDRLSLTQEVSILGVELMVFDGPDRAYLLLATEGKGFELNLESMEIVDRLDLTALLDPTQPTFMNSIGVTRGNETVAVTYATDASQETVSNESKIVFFDPTDGTLDIRDAPCGGLTYNMAASNGDLYFASDPWVAGINAIDPTRAPAPCLVRVAANSRDPDPNPIMLNDLTGGPTGGLIPVGDSSILVRVLDTDIFPLTDTATGFQAFGTPAWDTWSVDLTNPTSANLLDRSPVAGAILFFVIDGEVYENDTAADFSSTTFVRTTGPGAPENGLVAAGIPLSVVRLR